MVEPAAGPEIEMFSGPGCAFCAQTRTLLQANGFDWVEYDVEDPAHLAEFQERLPRIRALPQLFVDGEHIGSFEDVRELIADGRLG